MDPEKLDLLKQMSEELSENFYLDLNWPVYPNMVMRRAWFLMNAWIGAEVGRSTPEDAFRALMAVEMFAESVSF